MVSYLSSPQPEVHPNPETKPKVEPPIQPIIQPDENDPWVCPAPLINPTPKGWYNYKNKKKFLSFVTFCFYRRI